VTFTLGEGLQEVALLCETIRRVFPGHLNDPRLDAQIADAENLWNRRNWTGHLTASAIVIDGALDRCLMMRHKRLGLELVPGGHCDPFEHPRDAALRELIEETGLSVVKLCRWHAEHGHCPVDIDTHSIPADATRGEPAHLHHDFRYVFRLEGKPDAVLDEAEAVWLGWRPLAALEERYPRVQARLAAVIG
jgi:8-oxo-dGTP pyrophosphatase MutT (NUDIX family)